MNFPEEGKTDRKEDPAIEVLEELFRIAVRHHLFDNNNY